ncbi:RNA polymerase, sigma-24 subunit, ECF subfamily [Catenulispora acidiphila DSM 44928]|uniref:RNA polymerase sigma factor n=1 Tax=Catenulispora acidiphila (strain DSM 44928 / JCM 14897 / NBRC 102108 / NRRL B-24433 / ID139908) TaxID=479433 RepID=C7Q641_CATAD|nr:sigma-70 family RNA polymerase sigma factor [Catenulispora acidiphila]ACU72047.1 RNA polymerase, sigma-24 subunit, ECF subfamily [Catenulispora acidiphila DSM 44928]
MTIVTTMTTMTMTTTTTPVTPEADPPTAGSEMRVEDDFVRLADPFRPEILAHCYRMLGSIHDAEDLVQETYLRAWRSYEGFEGRASLRTWLYRIATNACLTALEHRARRPLPAGIGTPHTDPEGDLSAIPPEITWLQPFPDVLLDTGVSAAAGADPASVVAARSGLRLALVAALQYLPPRQRAVLILRDVLGWRSAEVAALLDLTVAAVNSLLKRARARLAEVAPDVEDVAEPTQAEQREILDRWAKAFVEADVDTLMKLLTEDAVYEMPPQPMWFRGAPFLRRLLTFRLGMHGKYRKMIPIRANGQPAFAVYSGDDDRLLAAESVQVLTLRGGKVARVTTFRTPGLVAVAGFPMETELENED